MASDAEMLGWLQEYNCGWCGASIEGCQCYESEPLPEELEPICLHSCSECE